MGSTSQFHINPYGQSHFQLTCKLNIINSQITGINKEWSKLKAESVAVTWSGCLNFCLNYILPLPLLLPWEYSVSQHSQYINSRCYLFSTASMISAQQYYLFPTRLDCSCDSSLQSDSWIRWECCMAVYRAEWFLLKGIYLPYLPPQPLALRKTADTGLQAGFKDLPACHSVILRHIFNWLVIFPGKDEGCWGHLLLPTNLHTSSKVDFFTRLYERPEVKMFSYSSVHWALKNLQSQGSCTSSRLNAEVGHSFESQLPEDTMQNPPLLLSVRFYSICY